MQLVETVRAMSEHTNSMHEILEALLGEVSNLQKRVAKLESLNQQGVSSYTGGYTH